MAERSERLLPPPTSSFAGIVGAEPYPVAKKAGEVIRRLLSYGVTRFLGLFRGSRSRSEIVATFLAVLELCKLKSIEVRGDSEKELSVRYLQTPEEAAFEE